MSSIIRYFVEAEKMVLERRRERMLDNYRDDYMLSLQQRHQDVQLHIERELLIFTSNAIYCRLPTIKETNWKLEKIKNLITRLAKY